jgi:nitrogen fixation protein FixH
MKKISWGTGISIVIILFLVIVIGQAIAIHYWIDYDLVVEEYYDEEIKYQSQIEKIKRTNALPESMKIKLSNEFIEFQFPSIFQAEQISGVINFYKPSDDQLDKKEVILLEKDNKMYFATKELSTGLWKARVEWEVDGVKYFNEKLLMVP